MREANISTDLLLADIAVETLSGVPDRINLLAEAMPTTHRFLRAAWFGGSLSQSAATLVSTRPDGTLLAAIPTVGMGPSVIGGRNVPGSYWPFRSILFAPDATDAELTDLFSHPLTAETLGPAWRLGPIYADDFVTSILKRSAARAGWTVLVRRLGSTFLFDPTSGWPGKSTRRRLANYARQLEQQGNISYQFIRGADWNDEALTELAAIEAASWVGRATDGTGAKFMSEERRDDWRRVLADPELANALTATILRVGGSPAALSFDLIAGPMQYSIASSYDERFAAFSPGKLVTAHQFEIARGLGVKQIDLGAGDSGYKRDMGAVRGSEILDLLIVRNRPAASLLKLKWGSESPIARNAYLTAARLRDAGRENAGRRRFEAALALGTLAAAAATFAD